MGAGHGCIAHVRWTQRPCAGRMPSGDTQTMPWVALRLVRTACLPLVESIASGLVRGRRRVLARCR